MGRAFGPGDEFSGVYDLCGFSGGLHTLVFRTVRSIRITFHDGVVRFFSVQCKTF